MNLLIKSKEKLNKEKQKFYINNKGITLIALIITVVILLILAVVAINAVQGDGIIGYAKNARDEYTEKAEQENALLSDYIGQLAEVEEKNSPKGTLDVTVGVYPSSVTVTGMHVAVSSVKKGNDEINSKQLTYIWYLNGVEKSRGSSDQYTFNDLDETKNYTVTCRVEDENGDFGDGNRTFISLSVDGSYYRCPEGTSWSNMPKYNNGCPLPVSCSDGYTYSDLRIFHVDSFDFECEPLTDVPLQDCMYWSKMMGSEEKR